jgi:hypothetical protein
MVELMELGSLQAASTPEAVFQSPTFLNAEKHLANSASRQGFPKLESRMPCRRSMAGHESLLMLAQVDTQTT